MNHVRFGIGIIFVNDRNQFDEVNRGFDFNVLSQIPKAIKGFAFVAFAKSAIDEQIHAAFKNCHRVSIAGLVGNVKPDDETGNFYRVGYAFECRGRRLVWILRKGGLP